MLAAAEGDRARAVEAMERSLASDAERLLYPFERARTLLAMGAVLRQAQQRRAARDAMERALGTFEALEARPWAEKAHTELGRISGRRASSSELSLAERRVAELAAAGRHNKEIAAEMFLSVATVEGHLTHVYRKLGVRSRTELARRLSAAGAPVRSGQLRHDLDQPRLRVHLGACRLAVRDRARQSGHLAGGRATCGHLVADPPEGRTLV
jgi:DNA-binding CsgD family transcriptional regulator